MSNCEICGRTQEEIEELAKKRSDMNGELEEDENGILRCGSCASGYATGKDKEISKKAEKTSTSFYDQINSGQLGSV